MERQPRCANGQLKAINEYPYFTKYFGAIYLKSWYYDNKGE